MELIMELLYENRRSYVEVRQVVCVVILALLFGGMYHYLSVHTEYRVESEKEDAAPVMPESVFGMKIDMKSFAGDLFAGNFIGPKAEDEAPGIPSAANLAANETEDIPNVFPDNELGISEAAKHKAVSGNKDTASDKVKKKAIRTESSIVENPVVPSVPPISEETVEVPPVSAETDIKGEEKAEETVTPSEPVVTKEISGFICNDKGHIIGYTNPSKFMKASLVVLPRDTDCTGITESAFKGLESMISEIYIPANITYIEAGAFAALHNLIFIEVDPRNTEFYSLNGVLYCKDGKVLVHPNRVM